ncbi:hypothetical protein EJ04DRAFT_516619 [Polyplosphaeria fusca]|uniref:Uncharacterized protein n=1 Tax=Polyplosphaeria fusca TaxID=682080 RepID=A0A9P4QP47_9PLEO|nr:hypothetical protein EJ04DRAFT_516619 [Polyplosphaeria fusca]
MPGASGSSYSLRGQPLAHGPGFDKTYGYFHGPWAAAESLQLPRGASFICGFVVDKERQLQCGWTQGAIGKEQLREHIYREHNLVVLPYKHHLTDPMRIHRHTYLWKYYAKGGALEKSAFKYRGKHAAERKIIVDDYRDTYREIWADKNEDDDEALSSPGQFNSDEGDEVLTPTAIQVEYSAKKRQPSSSDLAQKEREYKRRKLELKKEHIRLQQEELDLDIEELHAMRESPEKEDSDDEVQFLSQSPDRPPARSRSGQKRRVPDNASHSRIKVER